MRLAFREMWIGRPGPVHIEIPEPVIYATGDPTAASDPPARALPRPAAAAVRGAARARPPSCSRGAERPLVVAGSGVDRAGANEALLRLVELLGCPVITTMAGRATVPLDHPQHLYGYGPGADVARREADVVLVAGSRLGNLDLPYDKYWGDPARAKLIQIDIDPRHIGVTRPLALGIVADVKATLEALVAALLESRARATASARATSRATASSAARRRSADRARSRAGADRGSTRRDVMQAVGAASAATRST